MSNKNSISYRRVGDYFIPNLILPPGEVKITLGKWGERVPEGTQNGRTDRAGRRNMMHKDYLLKHKKVLFETLLTPGKLYQHCAEVEKQANEMFELLIEQMKANEGVTEALKEQNQWEWVQRMGNIQQQAREIVCNKLIYN